MNSFFSRLGSEDFGLSLEHSVDGVWIYDLGMRVQYVNKTAMFYNGVRRKEVLGKTHVELVARGIFRGSAVPRAFETLRPVTEEVLSLNGKPLICTAMPVFNRNKELQYVVSNVRDISVLVDLRRALEGTARPANTSPEDSSPGIQSKHPFLARSPQMLTIVSTIDRVASTDATVLLLGESGVGKDVLAQRLHLLSQRPQHMVIANCGAIPASLMESEFFGYEKGAFTGADTSRSGLFEQADGGTLMLDEVGELEPAMQVKLLRVLQEGKTRRVGGRGETSVNVRIIAATNRDLQKMMEEGQFRKDLFYRLNVISIRIPPLRERLEDVLCLIPHFLKVYNKKYGFHKNISSELGDWLKKYAWPGNVREMGNLMERLILLCPNETITPEYLPDSMKQEPVPLPHEEPLITLKEATSAVERTLLSRARTMLKNSRSMARALGVSHVTIVRKLKKYGLK